MNLWNLPDCANFGGRSYAVHTDYRDILEIFSYFEDPDLPDTLKWRIALALFYQEEIPDCYWQEAMEFFQNFLWGGRQPSDRPAPKLLDWQQDGAVIVAEVNKVAGQEIRALPYVHWWTFLAWFHGIGEGQLSMLVGLREKLRNGKKLEPHEKEYYRQHKTEVDIKPHYSKQELARQQALQDLLDGKG
ncbi:MAG: hypothetical protein IKK11_01510 [Oscillospiraceae bacterium]|nr:hypothetical protein [Oscillospiraceae bacterium]